MADMAVRSLFNRLQWAEVGKRNKFKAHIGKRIDMETKTKEKGKYHYILRRLIEGLIAHSK